MASGIRQVSPWPRPPAPRPPPSFVQSRPWPRPLTEPLSCIRAWVGWLSSLTRGMEVRREPQSGASCSSSPRDSSAVSVSKELLTAGSGGRGGDGRVAAAWGVHVRQGACGRDSGRPVAPCPGPTPARGRPAVTAGLLRDRRGGGGVRGPRGGHPASGPGMVVFRAIVGAHSAECSSRAPPLRAGPGEGFRWALRVPAAGWWGEQVTIMD